ncbi:hypothetical protein BXY85_2773 [Roseivirga pacifica]|uniref:Uncharacterized protein n=1 Tax=Roseivirga pacifica TaxID=1267423 RepID=A0A1I0P723_9BACT|nr:HEPN domain-containing protein [Roseivirga pacifica]RKQ51741.1 hypothetical protein BXY85_2773 [Roseivirga pacifica]SEW09816.1 hypothetical protein SAMN05216290_1754 [Roseivirga pacifica]
MKFVILIHLLNWEHHENEYILEEGISFINPNTHPVGKLYKKICGRDNIDEGEPYTFNTGLILYDETGSDHSFLPSSSHYSLSTTFINLLTIIYKGTLGHCRIIMSKDDFKTSHLTYTLYDSLTEFTDELTVYHSKFDGNSIEVLEKVWQNLKSTYTSGVQKSRIENMLNFFYFSWYTLTLELTGISLSIVLETLFSPHSNSELTHQIACNVSNLMGNEKEGKKELYKYVKKYYSIRSKLVHGETIKEVELNLIPPFFKFICEVILKIISDYSLIHTFNDNKKRREFIEDKLFE